MIDEDALEGVADALADDVAEAWACDRDAARTAVDRVILMVAPRLWRDGHLTAGMLATTARAKLLPVKQEVEP